MLGVINPRIIQTISFLIVICLTSLPAYTKSDGMVKEPNSPSCLDHVLRVEINTGWDYEDPDDANDTEYEFSLKVTTDGNVEKIEFLTPRHGTGSKH